MVRKGILTLLYILLAASVGAQELQVKVNINSSQVEGTDKSVFENLQQTLEQWMNDKQWTELQFQKDERINVNFNITVQKYDKANNRFECSAMIQANRPFMEENIDNQLTALMAYYAFLIIGLDLDSFGPMAGTEVLQRCMNLTNNAQDMGFPGWKAFEDSRNRFAIINDYLDEAMKPMQNEDARISLRPWNC